VGYKAFSGCGDSAVVLFTGDAPSFSSDAFYYSTITVCYPADNATWTEDVRQDYSAYELKWVPYQGLYILSQPMDAVAAAGSDVTFSVTAASTGAALTYQWQTSADGETWTDVEGATELALALELQPETFAVQYRLIVVVQH